MLEELKESREGRKNSAPMPVRNRAKTGAGSRDLEEKSFLSE